METELFNRQYIISKKELALDGWKQFLFVIIMFTYIRIWIMYIKMGNICLWQYWVICLTIGILIYK